MTRYFIIIPFLFFISLPGLCQDTDVELWLTAQVRKDFLKKFRFYFEPGYRRDELLVHTKTVYFETGGCYKLSKFAWFGSYYRFSTDFSGFRKNRLAGEVILRGDWNRLSIKSRSQYNAEFAKEEKTDHYGREKISFQYDIRNCKVDPFIASEAIFHLQKTKSENEQIRFDVGAEWKIAKRHTIEMYYRYRIKRNVRNPINSHIIGIDYIFEF